ncbi:MAG TPA: hypothetical protein VKX17_16405 [Planctomycetota bacterium]|nr:hypothetical protein [Planctomycetota bacterium]
MRYLRWLWIKTRRKIRCHANVIRVWAFLMAMFHIVGLIVLFSFLERAPNNSREWQVFWFHRGSPPELVVVVGFASLIVIVGAVTTFFQPNLGFWLLAIATLENFAMQIYAFGFDPHYRTIMSSQFVEGTKSSPLIEGVSVVLFLIAASMPPHVYRKHKKINWHRILDKKRSWTIKR